MGLFNRTAKAEAEADAAKQKGRVSAQIPRGQTLASVSAGAFFATRRDGLALPNELTAILAARGKTRAFQEQINTQLGTDSIKRARTAATLAYRQDPSPANAETLRNLPPASDQAALAQVATLRGEVKRQIYAVAQSIAPTVRAILERAADVVDEEIPRAQVEEEQLCAKYGLPYETGYTVGALQNLLRHIDRAMGGAGADFEGPSIEDLRGILPEIFAHDAQPVVLPNETPAAPAKPEAKKAAPAPEAPSDQSNFIAENPVQILSTEEKPARRQK